MSVHKDPLEECDEKSFRGFLVDSPLEVRLLSVFATKQYISLCYGKYL